MIKQLLSLLIIIGVCLGITAFILVLVSKNNSCDSSNKELYGNPIRITDFSKEKVYDYLARRHTNFSKEVDPHFLTSGYYLKGVDTVGQSLRYPNLQLRSEPANPRVKDSSWSQTTI